MVGSSVVVKVQKHGTGDMATIKLVRGAAERIMAIGQLFLILSEIISDLNHHKLPSVSDIERCVPLPRLRKMQRRFPIAAS